MQHTLVRHTGYSVGQDPDFARAVEIRMLHRPKDAAAVAKAGGLIFDRYEDAARRMHNENYPDPAYKGIIPKAKGKFKAIRDFDEEIYIPC